LEHERGRNVTEIGLLVRIEAKPEFAEQVKSALHSARDLAKGERETVTWFAFRQSVTVFGVFDAFNDEHGRKTHLQGGQEIDAEEALRLGLVAEVPPKDHVLDRAWEMAEQFTQRAPPVLRLTRRALTLHLKRAFHSYHHEGATLEMLAALAGTHSSTST
jgi:hypothetical protein